MLALLDYIAYAHIYFSVSISMGGVNFLLSYHKNYDNKNYVSNPGQEGVFHLL